MFDAEVSTRDQIRSKSAILRLAAGLAAAAILATGAVIVAVSTPARATAAFGAQTGLACERCHASATGGPLTSFGKAFKANGNRLPKGK